MAHILIIDDDVHILASLRDMLELEGHQVLDAADGNRGMNVLKKEQVDLVITDIIMPEKDGLETIMALRRDFPNVRIIAMSGGGEHIGQDDCLHWAKAFGAKQVLYKPLSRGQVLEAIGECSPDIS